MTTCISFLVRTCLPLFVIEHIACGSFFYGFGQQFPFRENKVDMVICLSFVVVQIVYYAGLRIGDAYGSAVLPIK